MSHKLLYFILLTLALILYGCSTDHTVQEDREHIKKIVESELNVGMEANEVAAVFAKHGTPLGRLNECSEGAQGGPDCKNGYWAVGIISLGDRGFLLGEGQAQVYMIFNDNKKLENNYFFELFYEKDH